MQLSSDAHIPDGLLAANVLLSEKPRQGVPSWNPALHQGIDEANCTAAIGLRASQSLNRIGSRYTGKERDTESGLDNFGARYYGSTMGRFMSPDDGSDQSPGDPQSWNLYSYVRNNPLSNTDPDGHDCINTSNLGSDGTVTVTSGTSCASDPGKYGTYVNGTVDTNSLTTDGKGSVGYSFTSYDGQNGGGGVISPAAPYGPLEGPANLAGANMIGNGGMAAINEFVKQSLISAAFEGIGQGIGLGVEAYQAGRAGRAIAGLREGGQVVKQAAAAGKKGAEIIQKGGGEAQAAREYGAVQGAESIRGDVRYKTLDDGSVVTLRGSSGGQPTISIQHADGGVTKIRY
jgi:RHS repeat-associated protein